MIPSFSTRSSANPPRLGHLHRAFLLSLGHHLLEHVGDVIHAFRCTLRCEHVEHRRVLGHLDLDFTILELAIEQQLAKLVARPLVAFLRGIAGLFHHAAASGDKEDAKAVVGNGLVLADGRGRRRLRLFAWGRRQQQIEEPLVHALVRELFDLRLALASHHVDRALDEIAHHRLDVATNVSDLRELGGFDLDEWRAG